MDEKGSVIAELDTLEARGLNLTNGTKQVIRVRAQNLRGQLSRLDNGRFDFQSFLPEHQGVNSALPYDIDIEGVNVRLTDRDGASPWSCSIQSPQVKVAGLGQDWIASTEATISGVGIVRTRIQNVSDLGLQITGDSKALQVASLANHLLHTADGQKLTALRTAACESLTVEGPFQVFVPRDKPAHFEAEVDARANQVRYRNFTIQSASFQGRITSNGISGTTNFQEGPSTASFLGNAVWNRGASIAGEVLATVPSLHDLPQWTQALVPKGARLRNGSFHGWLSAKSPGIYHLSGDLEAASGGFANQTFDAGRMGLEVQNDRIVLDIRKADVSGEPLTGIVTLNPKDHTVHGSLSAKNLDLTSVGSLFGYRQITGTAMATALINGSVAHPIVDFSARGQGIVTPWKDHTFSLGQFDLAGQYVDGSLKLTRGLFNAPEGLIEAHGSLGKTGSLGLQLTGRGVLIGAYDPRMSGSANLTASINGTLTQPRVEGRFEGYDVTYRTRIIPAIVGNFNLDRKHADFTDLEAAEGTTSLLGEGSIQFKTGAIEAILSASEIQLADWLNEDFVGAIDLPMIKVAGTIKRPLVETQVRGASLVIDGAKIDQLKATVELDGADINLHRFQLLAAEGSITATGRYNLDQRRGAITATSTDLSLDKLLPELRDSLYFSGKVSGTADLEISGTEINGENATGTMTRLSVNGSEIGSGKWDLHSNQGTYVGNMSVDSRDRFIHLKQFAFDPYDKVASGSLSFQNFPIEEVSKAVVAYLPNLSFDGQDSLLALSGQLSGDCTFSGTTEEPTLELNNLAASHLTFRKQVVGEVSSSLSVSHHRWEIHSLQLKGGPATVSLHGTIEESGQMHIDATSDNRFDLDQISHFDPRLSLLTGTAHVWFTADGPTQSPRIVASLNVDNLLGQAGNVAEEAHNDKFLRFEFDKIVIDPGNKAVPGIEANGVYFYKGLQGSLHGTLPFEYPFSVPADKPLEATVSFDKSDLKNIAQLVGGLDPTRTEGKVAGTLALNGTANNLKVTGNLDLDASSLAFTALDDVIKSVHAGLKLQPNELSLDGYGSPNRGGKVVAHVAMPLESFESVRDQVTREGMASLLDHTVTGQFTLQGLQLRQHIFGQSTVSGTADSEIQMTGTVRRPDFSGKLSIGAGDLVLKALPAEALTLTDHVADPTFHIAINLSDPLRIRSSAADMYLLGAGNLQGSLQDPKIDASMVVERGSIRLPASVLRVDQGGTIKFNYGSTGVGKASAVVDLAANTSVTATRYADSDVQRYDIDLGIKGDLFQDNGLNLVATSDPPDLTQERILGIIGAGDIFQSVSNGTKESSALQAAMLSTVPTLLDPYTSQVAGVLGLDFLDLQYNTYDLASVAFGKVLGYGLSVEGTRQLSEPPPGFPSRYDLRLLYRPRRLVGTLSRIRLFVGSDQDRPWKAGLEYGVRF